MKTRQAATFVAIFASTIVLFRTTLGSLANLSVHDDRYVQIAVSPLICLFLMFRERNRIFARARYSPFPGIPLLLGALLTGWLLSHAGGTVSRGLALSTVALVLVWMMAFLACWGVESFRAALFPLCCLFLMVPPTGALMDRITTGLQSASASISYGMFRLAGVPVFAQGTRFSLPGLDFDIKPECSGIRSTIALTLIALLMGRIFLRSGWRQLTLVVLTAGISIFKNAVRISVIASLSAYVNRAFLDSALHRKGGLVFSLLGVALFVPLLSALQRSELRSREGAPGTGDSPLRSQSESTSAVS